MKYDKEEFIIYSVKSVLNTALHEHYEVVFEDCKTNKKVNLIITIYTESHQSVITHASHDIAFLAIENNNQSCPLCGEYTTTSCDFFYNSGEQNMKAAIKDIRSHPDVRFLNLHKK